MKIISITSTNNLIVGLGDDNKTYLWDSVIGGWRKNWLEEQAPKPALRLTPVTKKTKKRK